MTSVFDADDALFVDMRFHVIVTRRHHRQRRQHIRHRDRTGGTLNPVYLARDLVAHLAEQIISQRNQLVLGAENDIFQLFQPVGRIALCVCQGLFTDEIIRHQILKGISHLKIVAKYLIELDFQVFDACLFTLALL